MARGGLRDSIVLYALVVVGASLCNLSQTAVAAMIMPVMFDLGIDVDTGQWLTSGYILALGMAVPIAAYLQRRVSDRVYAVLALSLFGIGSLICLVSTNFPLMLFGRIVQAVSGGLLIPQLQTIAMTRFPADRRATAMGIGGIGLGFAPNIGPTVGGAMDAAFGWRSFFVLMAAFSAILVILSLVFVRNQKVGDSSAKFERVSFVFSTLGFGGVLLGLSQASTYGLASAWVWGPLVVGGVFIVLFARREQTVSHPLIHFEIFDSKRFRVGLVSMCVLFASYLGPTLIIPLYVVNVLGGTSLEAGLVALPATITAIFMNPLSGIAADKYGERIVVLVTGALLVVGSIGCVFVNETTPLAQLTFFQTIRAMGVSGLIGPILSYSLSGLEPRLVGDGSASVALLRQAAGSFGTAAAVFILTALAPSAVAGGLFGLALPHAAAFGFSAVLAVALFVYTAMRVK